MKNGARKDLFDRNVISTQYKSKVGRIFDRDSIFHTKISLPKLHVAVACEKQKHNRLGNSLSNFWVSLVEIM